MGIYSRDYLRDDRRSWSGAGAWGTPGCKWIIVANIVVFVLQVVTTRPTQLLVDGEMFVRRVSPVTQALALSPERVLHGAVWRLVTYSFCNADLGREFAWHI